MSPVLTRRGGTLAAANARRPQRTPLRERVGARVGYRTRTLGVGIALALLAAVLTVAYTNRAEQRALLAAGRVEVLVVARDIAEGTPGTALLRRGLLVREPVPRRSVVPGAISDPAQVAKLVVAEPIYSGEQVTMRRFRPLAAAGVRGDLNGTARAIVLAGEPTQLLAGLVRAGDRVDVLATVQYETAAGRQRPGAKIALRDLRVIRAPGEADATAVSGRRGTTIALELTDAQAQKLFFAVKNGQWSLMLRPFGRAADTRVGVETANTVLGAGG
jgi:Flp pilus assembly protein CpaB